MLDLASRDSSFLTIGSMSPSPLAGVSSRPPRRAKKAADSSAAVMSMYSTKMSLGRASGVGAKLMMLFTPARTSVSATSCATSPGTVSTAICRPRSRTRPSIWRGVEAAHPVDERVGERGVDVERRHDRHGGTLVGEVGEDGVPEVAGADERDLLAQRSRPGSCEMLSMQAVTS